ncbi:fimbria/pilus outer membrane usher protein [Pseudomonas sp. nanlin1]|uniref:fimbria/pilus outer membrane usher protein n=1 Tax=Pseudomonas sp. nanlin1 TaxID=3040605 RepID=UPI00388F8026
MNDEMYLRRRPACLCPGVALALGGGLTLLSLNMAMANEHIRFESSFMRQGDQHGGDAGALAIRELAQRLDVGSGRHRVQVYVNSRWVDEHDLDFSAESAQAPLQPCLSADLLEAWGVRLASIADPNALQAQCIDLAAAIPHASTRLNGQTLRLDVSIPHMAMRRDPSGTLDPSRIDHGVSAAFVNYQATARHNQHRSQGASHAQDLLLNTGVNLGAWRLRSDFSLSDSSSGERHWERGRTYLRRDLPGTHAALTLGETFTPGEVFTSLPITGAVVASDLTMLADAMQAYAPVVRGVALSRARLEIRQNGYLVYTTYVSPGPYEIDDLNVGGSSGELEVTLTEDDGQVRRYTQPYATLANLLRPGTWRYTGAVGRYTPTSEALEQPLLWQGTLAMGAGWNSTLYGGALASDFYRAFSLGAARDFGQFGAFSADVIRSQSTYDQGSREGMSYALKYGKSFASRTHLRFAGYRYSTENYREFGEALSERNPGIRFTGGRRSRLDASIAQSIGQRSSLNLTFSQEDYWGTRPSRQQFQISANTTHARVSYGLYASQSLNRTAGNDLQVGLSLSMPLEFGAASSLSLDWQHSASGQSQRASFNGRLGQSAHYGASLANDQANRKTVALNVGQATGVGSMGAGLSYSGEYRNINVNASGALLAHGGGIELGPYLSETNALVHVPDTPGIGVRNGTKAQTGASGYALMPALRPYRVNQVELDLDELGMDTELDNGTQQVVPSRGALVKATFEARRVNRVILSLQDAQGLALPFGAQVVDEQGQPLGIVGQGGRVMLTLGNSEQRVQVRWGEGPDQQCAAAVDPQALPASENGYRLHSQRCD